jgi:hypothetical protein
VKFVVMMIGLNDRKQIKEAIAVNIARLPDLLKRES